ncbi:MAG: SDR family NAD(P)-dependent oxidoreductase [bacterium]
MRKMIDYKGLQGSKILVTGAAGFIGMHLCRALMNNGCHVTAVSRNSISDTVRNNYTQYAADLVDPEKVNMMIRETKPDFVFHLAGIPIGSRSLEFIPSTFEGNLVTTLNLLTAMTEQQQGKLIIAGSLEEPAGNSDEIPSSPYAMSKWAASRYAKMFYALYDTPVVHLRIFMVYGPGKQDENKLIPFVIKGLINQNPPELTSGNREIDWIYVEDVVEGMIMAALSPEATGQTIDIGSGNLLTTRELVEQIKRMMNSKTDLLFGSRQDRKMEQVRQANTRDTLKKIGWKPRFSLEKGLALTIDYFKEVHTSSPAK